MKIGIIGHGENKFTEKTKQEAKNIIRKIFHIRKIAFLDNLYLVSGHSPVGGVDIYAEEIAKEMDIKLDLKIPKQHKWDAEYGYKQRNIDIAKDSDEIYIILVDKYPPNYKGMRFEKCYHCNSTDHIKSGACWTGRYAKKLGKVTKWYLLKN